MSASLEDMIAKMKKFEALLAQVNSEEGRQDHMRMAEKEFPSLVEQEIKVLLELRSKGDIPRVLALLVRLKSDGMSGIWDDIKVPLYSNTRRQLGTLFTDDRIEAAKKLPLDMKGLGLFVWAHVLQVDRSSSREDHLALISNVCGIDAKELHQEIVNRSALAGGMFGFFKPPVVSGCALPPDYELKCSSKDKKNGK